MAKRVLHEGTLADFDAGSVIDATASIAAVRPLSGGYVTFSSPAGADAPFETHVLRFDELGNPVDSVGTFPGRTVGASLRSDGAYLIVYSRPADSREAAGATQVFTRLLSPASSRTRAVQH